MNARTRRCLLTLALLVGISGCGGSGLVTATGRVTYKGEPVPSTQVMFLPEDGSRRSTAVTDDDGKFTLRNSRTEAGATCGKHTVTLKYVPSADEGDHTIPPKALRPLQEVIARYGDPTTTTLHYEITKSGQFIEIKLDQ